VFVDKISIRNELLTSPIAAELILALNAELSGRYPEDGATHFHVEPDEVQASRGVFLVASLDGAPAACGALRVIAPGVGELKRMYVVPALRGRGLGQRVLDALEHEAVLRNVKRLVLETGSRQPEALAMYRNAGFQQIPPFGEYEGSPLSLCMEKWLRAGDAP
jgi:putative acetyltransferase